MLRLYRVSPRSLLFLILLGASLLTSFPGQAALSSWSSNGPLLIPYYSDSTQAQVRCLGLFPNFAQTPKIFAGSDSGYLYTSSDGGGSWVNLNMKSLFGASYMHAVAVASDNQTVFVCAWGGGKIIKSTDGGANWTSLPGAPQSLSCSLSPDFVNDRTMFVTGNFGVMRSTDGGATWATKTNGLKSWFYYTTALSPNYPADKTVFVVGPPGIYKSTDGGETWVCKNGSLPTTPQNYDANRILMPYVNYVVVSPNYPQDRTLFTVVNAQGVYKSTDGGDSWTCVTTLVKGVSVMGGMAISPNYANDGTVMLGYFNDWNPTVLISFDKGNNWNPLPRLPDTATSQGPVAFSPNFAQDRTIFVGVDGLVNTNGVFSYTFPPPTNQAPVLSAIGNKTVGEGQTLQFSISATDPDGNALTYSASNLPTGATFAPATGTFSWTPGYNQAGTYPNVLFTVTDNGTPPLSASEAITITVGNVNRAPILNSIGPKSVNEGDTLTFTIAATDPDGDSLTYEASNLPTGAQFDKATMTFTWKPTYSQAGSYQNIIFSVTDGSAIASEAITITVGNANRPPVLNPIGTKNINEGQLLEFMVTAQDPDNDTLLFSAGNLPTDAGFNPATQKFSWTPNFGQAGNYTVTFTVTDNGSPALSDYETITITVGHVNRPPVLDAIGNKTVKEGETLTFSISATDPDQDPLTYSASNLPTGATFDTSTRVFTWTPGYNQADNYTNVRFAATDSGGLSASETITITVGNVNRPPILDPIGAKTVLEGETLNITLTASDPDGDALTFSTGQLPPGASFSGQTFTWTPGYDQSGSYVVEFCVQDCGIPLELAVEVVTITVGNLNRAPVFEPVGSRQTVEGQKLEFYVKANDPDGDALTYYSSQLPTGASFDPNTRLFSWTPSYGQTGSYMVTFKATDGSQIGETSVPISVSQPSPSELITNVVKDVIDLNLSKAVENPYIANLKKVDGFIVNGQKPAALNQLNAFINKVRQDMAKGLIGTTEGKALIQKATELINMLINK